MDQRKILILEGRATIGGGQVITKYICQALENEKAVFLPGPDTPLASYLSDYRQFYYTLREYSRGRKTVTDYWNFLRNSISTIRALCNAVDEFKPDIIYVQHTNIIPFAVVVGKLRNLPVCVHVHVVIADGVVRKFVELSLRSKTVKRVVAVSNYAVSQFQDSLREKATVVYNHVPMRDAIMPVASDCVNVAVVGDVVRTKGHHVLVRAASLLNRKVRIHVVGRVVDPSYREELEMNCSHAEIVFTGMIDDVYEYMRRNAIMVVVVPSVSSETFSLAMVEAWAAGIPTIATADYGMKELVGSFMPEYSDSMLFPMADADALASKLQKLLTDNKLRQSIASAARTVVEKKFSFDKFSREISHVCNFLR